MPSEVREPAGRSEKRRRRGTRGLDSIRAKILAAIVARDYQHAHELLELAANMSEDERAPGSRR
jgi:hypothetical protein